MLLLSKMILNRPIMSLRTGQQIATANDAIINPNNLKIEGFYCTDYFSKTVLILLPQDIRDVLPVGFVVNDHAVLSEPDELIRLQKTMDLSFELIGKGVYTKSNKKIGKVTDYATEPEGMIIKKLYVTQSLLKNLAGGSLSVDRTQIIEITSKKIIIKDPLQGVKAGVPAFNPSPAS